MQRTLILCFLLAAGLPAQELVFSLSEDPASGLPWAPGDVLVYAPSMGTRDLLPAQALAVLVRDADQNGIFDDAPSEVDAFTGSGGLATDWLLSTTVTVSLPGSGSLLDGDVFRMNPDGALEVVHPEVFFEAITGCSGVDVDALAEEPSGTLYFSFADDETTVLSSLISQNGGTAVLDEQTVFRLDPGEAEADIHFTKSQAVGFFAQAFGGSPSSVVDITGLAPDPAGAPGDLLLTSASSSQSYEGRVVTSRSGGLPFQIGGIPVDSASLGLGAATKLSALGFTVSPAHPSLRVSTSVGSASSSTPETVTVQGLLPGEPVQLVITGPRMTSPWALVSPALPGFGALFSNTFHPMWSLSFQTPVWTLVADSMGTATHSFTFAGLLPGVQAVVQAVGLVNGRLTNPAAVAVVP